MTCPQPNFYVVGAHGTGLQSFLYYLHLIQCPATPWWQQDRFFLDLKERFPLCGFTVDRRLEPGETEPFAPFLKAAQVPVFWLTRDPVDVIAACVNQRIGDAVLRAVFDDTLPVVIEEMQHKREDFATYKKFIEYKFCFPYVAFLKRLENYERVMVYDVSDLMPEKIGKTLARTYFEITGQQNFGLEELKEKFSVSYNSFLNRSWTDFPERIYGNDKVLVEVKILPTQIADFFCYRDMHKYVQFSHNGAEYKFCTKAHIDESMLESLFFANKDKVILDVSFMHKLLRIAHVAFERLRVSKSFVVDMLQKNKEKTGAFKLMMQNDMSFIEKMTGVSCPWDSSKSL